MQHQCVITHLSLFTNLCGNVSKSLKKVQIVRLQFSSYKHYWGKRDAKPRPPVRDRGNAKVQFGVKDSFFSWFNKSIQILAKQWKICHPFCDSRSVSLSEPRIRPASCPAHVLSRSVSLEPPVTELDESFKKEKEATSTNNWTKCKLQKFQHISRFSYRTLTSAEFRSSLQHCSPATTDALLRLWPPRSHFLRPLWCTGSLTVCGL